LRPNEATTKAPVVSLFVVVRLKLAKQMARIAVRTAGGDGHALHADGIEQRRPRLSEQRIAIVNEVGGTS